MPTKPLTRLRKICLALPEAHEVKAWGEPTFRVRNKLFAMFASAGTHHGQGRPAVWCKAGPGNQEIMVRGAPEKFFVPPYVGPSGWIGVWLDGAVDWVELAELLRDSHGLVAPKRVREQPKPKLRRNLLSGFLIAADLMALSSTRAIAQEPPPGFDRYVKQVMEAFTVPGLSVAIVKDGKVVLAKGYGVRRMGSPAPVDAQTRFGIASNTKLFTATALALLVEEGKIEWDKPVVSYLPAFAMSDPYVTQELTVRDLLVHRSGLGLGAGDLLWWPPSTYDRKEIARRIRHIPLATSFRSTYAYDNVLYLIAGELIEAVSGQTWENFVRNRILQKVGMRDSDVRHSGASELGNTAGTHAEVDDTVRPVDPFASDNTNPAGGIMAGAADMARWMIVQLDSGRVGGGSRLFSAASTRQLWREVTPTPIAEVPKDFPQLRHLRATMAGYALGLGVRDYRGYILRQHTGGLPGYLSKVAMIADLRLGVAVLTNQESSAAFDAIAYRVLDHYIGAKSPDYPSLFQQLARRNRQRMEDAEQKAAVSRDSTAGPSLPLAQYAGTYRDPWYGDVQVTQEKGGLAIRFRNTPSLVGDLVHWQHDTFLARWRDRELRADAYATFWLNADGSVHQLRMVPASESVDFSFDFQDLALKPVADSTRR